MNGKVLGTAPQESRIRIASQVNYDPPNNGQRERLKKKLLQGRQPSERCCSAKPDR